MCGAALNIDRNTSVAVCEYCGTRQTLPKLDDDRRTNLYDRAGHFRRNNEFDKAAGLYEQILSEDASDAEAYWSLVLCRYGIEYVEDPVTKKRIPTVNRTQLTSVYTDENYKEAILHADAMQRPVYEEEAGKIDEIQKGILKISSQEKPFDIFICYKETDEQGRRTRDSVLANELYYQLVQEGYKVFFSRITLEDKLGSAYEPYIFAALHSAKVMVVIGTRAEYFNAVWVKNEWSRYLSLIKNGAKKTLIPAYRDMDPYDLPEEFAYLQALDMSKLGFMQDLIRGIRKIIGEDRKENAKQSTSSMSVAGNSASTAPLVRRMLLFLEDGEWESAEEYTERILDQEPENAMAYVGKLMAELHVPRMEKLADLEESFADNRNYGKAMRFADGELRVKMQSCLKAINERKRHLEQKAKFQTAEKAKDRAVSAEEYLSAAAMFEGLGDYPQATEWGSWCRSKAKEIKESRLQELQEQQDQQQTENMYLPEADEESSGEDEAEKKSGKRGKGLIWIIVALAVVSFLTILTVYIIPLQRIMSRYDSAVELFNSGDYDAAYKIFDSLNYKDSAEKAADCKFFKQKEGLTNLSVGSTIKFGIYEQDNNTSNGREEIEWRVLALDGSKALIISQYALDCKAYNGALGALTDTTWEKCTLRAWLNNTFYDAAFDPALQKMIVRFNVTTNGNHSMDKVFLLSSTEVYEYFSSDEDRKCAPTDYARKVVPGYYRVHCNWWLRNLTDSFKSARYVDYYGYETGRACPVNDNCWVRPAIWIDLGSEENANLSETTTAAASIGNSENNEKHARAMGLLDAGAYEEAYKLLEEIGDEESIKNNKYDRALSMIQDKNYDAATNLLSGLNYRDSESLLNYIIEQHAEEELKLIRTAEIGSTVFFGRYEQDNDLENGKERIEWIVVEHADGNCLLISKNAIECRPWGGSVWGNSTLRRFLNEEFIQAAFSTAEKSIILKISNPCADIHEEVSQIIENTEDMVFCLSRQEVEKYIKNEDRVAAATEYAESRGCYVNKNFGSSWWLRDISYNKALYIRPDGSLNRNGQSTSWNSCGVRPAIWICPDLSDSHISD